MVFGHFIQPSLLAFQSHCDFSPLRHLLLATHMQDLKDVTHAKHYEDYRRQVLGGMLEQEVGLEFFKLESDVFLLDRDKGGLP